MAGTKIGSAYIDVDADTKGFESGMKGFVSRGLKILGPLAAGMAAIGAAKGLISAGKMLQAAGEEAATNAARIEQVAASMGRTEAEAAALTTRLTELSESTTKLTGVDDDLIQQSQAILLTFREVGKTADAAGGVFDRATQAAIDLAATGFGSIESNSVQLGKALQDPIKGLAALGRSGVTFTAEQKKLIASMVETGNILGAQEIVLAAVESQVGGVAEATAKTSDKVRESWDNVVQNVGGKLLPVFDRIGEVLLEDVFPKVETFADTVIGLFDNVLSAFDGVDSLGEGLGNLFAGVGDGGGFSEFLSGLLDSAKEIFGDILDWLVTDGITMIVTGIISTRQRLLDAALRVFPVILEAISSLLPQIVTLIVTAVPQIVSAAVALLTAIIDAVPIIIPALLDAVLDLVMTVAELLPVLIPVLLEAALDLLTSLITALAEILPAVLKAVIGLVSTVAGLLPKLVPTLLSTAITLFLSLVTALLEVLPDLLKTILADVLPAVITALIGSLPEIVDAALLMFFGIVDAIQDTIPLLIEVIIFDVIPAIITALIDAIPDLIDAGFKLITGLGEGMVKAAGNVVGIVKDKVIGAVVDLWPFSPAKTGPFRTHPPEVAGANIMGLFAAGLASAGTDAIRTATTVARQLSDQFGTLSFTTPIGFDHPDIAALTMGGSQRDINLVVNMESNGVTSSDAARAGQAIANIIAAY